MKITGTDRVLLIYPIVFYILALSFAVGGKYIFPSAWGVQQIKLGAVFVFVLLGNFAHNFISLWQLFRVQEFQEWTREYRFMKLSIWQLLAIIFLFFTGLVFLLPNGFDPFAPPKEIPLYARVIIFSLAMINIHHTLAQFKGISISLSHRYSSDKEKIGSITQKEKTFYKFLLIDAIFFVGPTLLLQNQLMENLFWPRTLILFGFYAWITFHYSKLPKQMAWMKIIYNVRNIYRFFFTIHPVIAFIGFGLHGADALIIYWNSLNKSASAAKKALKLEFLCLLVIFGVSYILLYRAPKPALIMTAYFIPAFLVTHYLIEGFMYRMQNPVTRNHISKII